MENVLYQSHIGSWSITILLFLVSFALLKLGKPKGQKITHMILRLFFLIMIVSGIGMLISYGFPLMHIVKGIVAIWLIGVMEGILSRAKSGSVGAGRWVQFVIALLVVVLLGFRVISF